MNFGGFEVLIVSVEYVNTLVNALNRNIPKSTMAVLVNINNLLIPLTNYCQRCFFYAQSTEK